MYESYPVPGPEPEPEPERIQPPNSVRNAVKLMYAGAALEVVALIVALLTRSSFKSAILKAHPGYTAAQLNTAENGRVVSLAIGAVITIGLWLWMAWANGRGRNWARIVSAVLFGINTLDLIVSIAVVRAAATDIVGVVIWLVGLAAIVLLFRKESGPYFRPQASAP
jgi:hypothetical protein